MTALRIKGMLLGGKQGTLQNAKSRLILRVINQRTKGDIPLLFFLPFSLFMCLFIFLHIKEKKQKTVVCF